MKSLPTEQEKIFANNMPDKELIYNLYKELLQLHFKDTNKKPDLKKNGQRIWIDIFPRKTERNKRHMKKCLHP